MTTITIEDSQAKLPELIGGLSKVEELVITQGDRVIARLVGGRSERWNDLALAWPRVSSRSWRTMTII